MPLGLWIWSAFTALVTLLSTFITKQIAIVAAAIIAFGAILATFKLAVDAAIGGLLSITPTGFFLFGLQLLPSNTNDCITAMALCYTASHVYVYWRNIIAFRLTPN